ncbi:MAG: TAT-variant-translocated molybdopterin oxidoreductase [Acidobacteria bacterium]|nr:TAT-variant-translocated molybdopterin oxidoreductase [Acidobacteriota bacterium]
MALDLAAIRARLAGTSGRTYWRSLEELAETPAFLEYLRREFPAQASEWTDPVGRRHFLKLMGASLALAGVTACTKQPPERIVPYVQPPEEIVPGRPLFFATAISVDGIGTGVLVESHMGRPTKIEGNPDHPASLGASDTFGQAAILGLYDPDRSQTLTLRGEVRPWGEFLGAMQSAVAVQRARQGAGLRILTGTVTSPTLADQIRALLQQLPQAKWHQYDPAGRDAARQGAALAFGRHVDTIYRFDRAEVVVSLDADVLSYHPGHLRYTRDLIGRRRLEDEAAARQTMNRLYVVESTFSITGAKADHRLPLRPSLVEPFARALAARLAVTGAPADTSRLPADAGDRWIPAIARDLQAHRGASIVIAGDHQAPSVHAVVHAINHALGNVGSTVVHIEPIEADPVDQHQSLRALAADMESGRVETLVIVDGNPAYDAPADLRFDQQLARVGLRVHLGLYHDETAELCHWHIPQTHPLETWSDTRAYDGTVTICQPLIAPLYGGKSPHELFAAFTDRPERSSYDIVREFWHRAYTDRTTLLLSEKGRAFGDFEHFWRRALHDGVVAGSTTAATTVGAPNPSSLAPPAGPTQNDGESGLEILFRPDPTVHDGRFANNGWLQELPKPFTNITWDNAAHLSPATAGRLGLANEDLVTLRYRGRVMRAPVWILAGHADDCVTITLGYGRRTTGRAGTGTGVNAYAIRTSDSPWFGRGLAIEKLGTRYLLATTQHHHTMEGRDLVRAGTLEDYRQNPAFAREMGEEPPRDLTLYPPYEYHGYAWGMAIDLNACIGCNACVIACQAENNIPIVGKDQVRRGREMHWLRVDSYFAGEGEQALSSPEAYFQPVPCMHCENAPCELVCPVAATAHSAEGLNDMVYNRCVGTRYCSNNCPYKVRRFNFLLYSDFTTPSLKLARNPDVTVRSRGVMEKCTYCVQRINAAKIDAERDGRAVRDGEIQTACQAVCPAEAIVFGNINDRKSRVATLKAQGRTYGLLADLNTRPRTTYLAAVRNPNPDLEGH